MVDGNRLAFVCTQATSRNAYATHPVGGASHPVGSGDGPRNEPPHHAHPRCRYYTTFLVLTRGVPGLRRFELWTECNRSITPTLGSRSGNSPSFGRGFPGFVMS